MNKQYEEKIDKKIENKLYNCAFIFISLNLLWAVFADSFLGKLFFPACIVISLFMFHFLSTNSKMEKDSYKIYISMAIWIVVMFFGFKYMYPVHSEVTFLFLKGDSYAIFFIRLFVSILPCMFFVDNNEFTINKAVKIMFFIIMLTSLFFVLRAVIFNPDALRLRRSMENTEYGDIIKYTPGYAMVYAYAILLPAFLHKMVNSSGDSKKIYIFCVLAMFYILLVSQYATALIMGFVGILVYFFLIANQQTRAYLGVIYLMLGMILLLTDGGAGIFQWLSTKVDGKWAEKLQDIAVSLSGGETTGDLSARTVRYELSLKAFLESPLFGKFAKETGKLGGHSTAFDILGLTGLLGFIPCMYSIYGTYLRMKNHPSFEKSKPAVISCILVFLIMIFLKNIITSLPVFFAFYVMVPLLLKSEEG